MCNSIKQYIVKVKFYLSQFSVTENVFAQSGFLFGGLYDEELGLSSSMKINVFDTPGFADADIDNIRKNKLLIASLGHAHYY